MNNDQKFGNLILKFWILIFFFIFFINSIVIQTKTFPEILLINLLILIILGNISAPARRKRIKFPKKIAILCLISSLMLFISYFKGGGEFSKEIYRLLFIPPLILALYLIDYDLKKIVNFIIRLSLFGGVLLILEFILLNLTNQDISEIFLLFQRNLRGVPDDFPDRFFGVDYFFGEVTFLRPNGIFNGPQKSGFLFVIGSLFIWFRKISLRQKKYDSKNILFLVLLLIFTLISTSRSALFGLIAMYFFMFKNKKQSSKLMYLILALYILWAMNLFINTVVYFGPLYTDLSYFLDSNAAELLFGQGMLADDSFADRYGIVGEHFLIRLFIVFGIIPMVALFSALCLLILELRNFNKDFCNYIMCLIFIMTFHYSIVNEYFIFLSIAILIASSIKANQPSNNF